MSSTERLLLASALLVTGAGFAEFGLLLRAFLHGDRAARMEAAALGRVERAGHIALQDGAGERPRHHEGEEHPEQHDGHHRPRSHE